MQKIVPHLWFTEHAEDAAACYAGIFPQSQVGAVAHYSGEHAEVFGRQAGAVTRVDFELAGQSFIAFNGGPRFQFTPAVSFFVSCANQTELETLWSKLAAGGTPLMPLAEYPGLDLFGWVQDKFGVSWQMSLRGMRQKITPALMFIGPQYRKAEEAMNFYVSLFPDSGVTSVDKYGAGEHEAEGTVRVAVFQLAGQEFMVMENSFAHAFGITGAIAWLVRCETQSEIDRFRNELARNGKAEPDGWVQDQYGVYWIVAMATISSAAESSKSAESPRPTR